jgi:BirA family biotin operon repressor/biotin-[acetyl-CoA-carboxylase] ligase
VAVIGIGVNWSLSNQTRAGIGQAVAELAPLLAPDGRDRTSAAGRILEGQLAMIERFRAGGLTPFLADFGRLDALAGHQVTVHAKDGPRPGIALGVARDGSLRIDHDGVEHRYHSAEISVRRS